MDKDDGIRRTHVGTDTTGNAGILIDNGTVVFHDDGIGGTFPVSYTHLTLPTN